MSDKPIYLKSKDAFEVEPSQMLKFKMLNKMRSVSHIFHVIVNYQIVALNVEMIAEKVIYLPEFNDNTSTIKDQSGFIVRTIHLFHN